MTTHMQGCFGSSLAFAPKSAVCSGCNSRSECELLVTNRRPTFLRLLDKFLDAEGKPMSNSWRTPAERKLIRDAARAVTQQG